MLYPVFGVLALARSAGLRDAGQRDRCGRRHSSSGGWTDRRSTHSARADRRRLHRVRLAGRVTAGGERPAIVVEDAMTGRPLGEVAHCTAEDVAEAARRARAAQADWAATPVRERAQVLLRFHDLVLERQDEVLDLLQLENGKARSARVRGRPRRVRDRALLRPHRAGVPAAQAPPGCPALHDAGVGAPPSQGAGRGDLAVELPPHAGDQRRAAGDRGGQRRAGQARRPHAVLGAVGRRPLGGGGDGAGGRADRHRPGRRAGDAASRRPRR